MAVDENIFEKNEENSTNNLQISDESNILAPVEFSQMAPPKNVKVSQKNRKPGSSKFNENEDRTQEVFEKKNDDFDAFGDIVARKVRNLQTHYAQCTIQHLINNLLYDGELGKYDVPLQTFQVSTNYNNYIHGSVASTSSNQTLTESSAIDESSSAST